MRKPFIALGLVALLTAAFVAPAAAARPDNPGAQARPTIVSVASALNASGPYQGQFDTLLALATQYPDIVAALSGTTQLTLFAPTDAAFEALFEFAAANDVELTSGLVKKVLLYHVTAGRFSADRLSGTSSLTMLDGESATISADGGIQIQGANVIAADVNASNGFIHAIDAVIIPPSVAAGL
jgi:transforming growth factor-beta-induced protein